MPASSLNIILDAQLPFVRHLGVSDSVEESVLFHALSWTYLPLLRSMTTLETEGIPFKLSIAFSPALCEMLGDSLLQKRYVEHLERTIGFGLHELERCAGSDGRRELIKHYLDQMQLNRRDYVDVYDRDILRKFDYFATRGFLEILATAATACFFPLYADIPEAVNAQIETGLHVYRSHFTAVPNGFWLPRMGFRGGLETVLKAYGFSYTVVESHGALFADPPAELGLFGPSWCPNGFAFYGRDWLAERFISDRHSGSMFKSAYLDTDRDIGFELTEEELKPLFDISFGRRQTGFRYFARGSDTLYNAASAYEQLCADASAFVEERALLLSKASGALEGRPVSLVCALPATLLGQTWAEGILWLETVLRLVAARDDLVCGVCCPPKTAPATACRTVPFYSSSLPSGYANEMLSSANDWMFPYIRKATQRMIDLAERFPDDTGLKERALNMAAREILLAQSCDWPLMMNDSATAEYGRYRFEDSVRAFTVVYESLGSNFISTEWLTSRERLHNLFPAINYRVFRKRT